MRSAANKRIWRCASSWLRKAGEAAGLLSLAAALAGCNVIASFTNTTTATPAAPTDIPAPTATVLPPLVIRLSPVAPTPTPTPIPPATMPPSAELVSDLTPRQGAGAPPAGATGGGPWETRLMLAAAPDGVTFTRSNIVLSDQAGVPNVMLGRDGRPRVYYIDFGNGNILAAAVQNSAGAWILRRVTVTGLETGSDPVDPTVVLLPDGQYRLYYMQAPAGGRPTIYSALSGDGLTFTREAGVRYGPSDVYDPTVLWTPAGWWLWTGPEGQHLARSTDGLVFEDLGAFMVDGQAFMTWAAATVPGQGYRLYGSLIGPGSEPGIHSAFSPDGRTWHLETGTRLAGAGDPALEANALPDCGVAELSDGSYLMAYLAKIP